VPYKFSPLLYFVTEYFQQLQIWRSMYVRTVTERL